MDVVKQILEFGGALLVAVPPPAAEAQRQQPAQVAEVDADGAAGAEPGTPSPAVLPICESGDLPPHRAAALAAQWGSPPIRYSWAFDSVSAGGGMTRPRASLSHLLGSQWGVLSMMGYLISSLCAACRCPT